MKLRMKGNSLRLRITRTEMETLIHKGRIQETTWLGPGADCRLTYALELSNGNHVTLRCVPPEIAVLLPRSEATAWRNGDQAGIYATAEIGPRGFLELMIEKDFACLDRSDADKHDTFPHPLAGAVC